MITLWKYFTDWIKNKEQKQWVKNEKYQTIRKNRRQNFRGVNDGGREQ